MGVTVIRVLAGAFGVLLMFAGIATAASPGGIIAALPVFLGGAAIVVGVSIERMRYRSDTLDRDFPSVGPGGGEPPSEGVEPRFRPTEEVFVDPTTARRMRVLLDPSTGERRYVAED